jgi:copper chaperone
MMETKQFKSNIKCSACVAKVTEALNETVGEGNWEVDLQNPQRVLTVKTDTSKEKINEALTTVGYRVENL